jgi:hypothetical protein
LIMVAIAAQILRRQFAQVIELIKLSIDVI